jgi:hypothetical protein
VVPLWQVAQPLTIPAWLNVAGFQAAVLWHVSHAAVVATCPTGFVVAKVPLWQVAQPAVIPVWFIFVPANVTVLRWHVSQAKVVGIWVAFLPMAWVPL